MGRNRTAVSVAERFFFGRFPCRIAECWYGVIVKKMNVPHDFEAENTTKEQMSAIICGAV